MIWVLSIFLMATDGSWLVGFWKHPADPRYYARFETKEKCEEQAKRMIAKLSKELSSDSEVAMTQVNCVSVSREDFERFVEKPVLEVDKKPI